MTWFKAKSYLPLLKRHNFEVRLCRARARSDFTRHNNLKSCIWHAKQSTMGKQLRHSTKSETHMILRVTSMVTTPPLFLPRRPDELYNIGFSLPGVLFAATASVESRELVRNTD